MSTPDKTILELLTTYTLNEYISRMNIQAFEKAVDHFTTQTALAESLGVSLNTVNNWLARGSLPPERAIEIENATGGAVTREDLLPEIFLAPRPVPAQNGTT